MPEFLACELEVNLSLQSAEPAASLPAWLCWMPPARQGAWPGKPPVALGRRSGQTAGRFW